MAGLKYTYVAEKPKAGRAIAAELARLSPITEQDKTYIRGADWAVCWAQGHIFELHEPEHYLEKRHPNARRGNNGKLAWDRAHLPLIPKENEFELKCTNREYLPTIRKLVSECEVVVHAGDPDREGQLVVDEILHQLKVRKPVKRFLCSGQDELSVRMALKDLRDNREFEGMSNAAKARSFADWLAGMNMSRALTLRAKACGSQGLVPYGRVQTAVLGLIVQRELDIQGFVPTDYLKPSATFQVAGGLFKAQWLPGAAQAGLDAERRLIDPAVGAALQRKVAGQQGSVVEYTDVKKLQGAPLPFSLARLQMLASKRYGYTPDATLEGVQALYDAKLVSYPRTGSQNLPMALHSLAPQTLANAAEALGLPKPAADLIDPSRKSPAWNDEKAKAHHGIIPLTTKADLSKLSPQQRNLYLEICKRYVAQFMPPREYRAVSAVVQVHDERFKATGNTTLKPGWKVLYGDEEGEEDDERMLPAMGKDTAALCKGLDLEKKRTEPPKRFTDSTLLAAMLNIHEFVSDPKIVATFKKMRANSASDEDVGGLGTPATRQTFVKKLEGYGLIRAEAPKGKAKEATYFPEPGAMTLMKQLPSDLGKPDTTAVWESVFESIEAGKTTVGAFLVVQENWIKKTLDNIDAANLANLNIVKPAGGGGGSRGRGRSASGGRPGNYGRRAS
ncbi:DNA topoisomerase [Pseudoxanthomonas kaohsiungensis]|uniref:DNA topoisomerase n=1 Tax=Pseudoxanthomonas kaohsiungensis TaxID=283923 RepID=A0ABW3LXE7_9GAMM|nr:DNA topoisomerase [Pseudoxanthomonas kaohsiungensis]KAF1702941.1 DNA topoisomerase [Pseudoxanthomonas kaohsiungensis]